ncbi:MAG: sugar phosphate isomerase/epimerase [Oscillospiraceae bacterium]|jgi:sugar phosphate isomerase/epimerase|nr:sugar phosphate isomerase/epimerase [Oscillospiraceae bacterium]
MPNLRDKLYVSTVAEDARETATRYGLGIEVAEFCTAMNMDPDGFPAWDAHTRANIDGIARKTFHAPFNELCPAAIEPRVVTVTRERYRQAAALAQSYGIRRMIVHSGYVPLVYFKSYFIERSIAFWRALLAELPPDFHILLENVMEDEPALTRDIARAVDDPRFRLCLDVGHANTIVSDVPLAAWIDETAPYLAHVHLHNNHRKWDDHNPLGDGLIDMNAALERILRLAPDATLTLESIQSAPSAQWLADHGYLA